MSNRKSEPSTTSRLGGGIRLAQEWRINNRYTPGYVCPCGLYFSTYPEAVKCAKNKHRRPAALAKYDSPIYGCTCGIVYRSREMAELCASHNHPGEAALVAAYPVHEDTDGV